jgi:hypothetical protein
MELLTRILSWLNAHANAIGGIVLAPLGAFSGWLTVSVVAVVTGVLLLLAFKYTSPQQSIKRVRADIKANLLALKLFKDSAYVAMNAQGRIMMGAFWLRVYAIVPIVIMSVPVLLVLCQLGLWYQFRPLRVHEQAILTLQLNGGADAEWPEVRLDRSDAIEEEKTLGPVRIQSERQVCWEIRAAKPGQHRLVFHVGDKSYEKEFAVGDGIMRVSTTRPRFQLKDVMLNPLEKPFDTTSPVQSIEIVYPKREWLKGGTNIRVWDWLASVPSIWVWYWVIISMIAAFCFRGVFHVNI